MHAILEENHPPLLWRATFYGTSSSEYYVGEPARQSGFLWEEGLILAREGLPRHELKFVLDVFLFIRKKKYKAAAEGFHEFRLRGRGGQKPIGREFRVLTGMNERVAFLVWSTDGKVLRSPF